MRELEYSPQEFVSVSRSSVKCTAGFLVVAIIGERASFPVEGIRPVRVRQRRRENDELKCIQTAAIPKASHVADVQQLREWIVSRVSVPPTLIDSVNLKIGDGQIRESHYLHGLDADDRLEAIILERSPCNPNPRLRVQPPAQEFAHRAAPAWVKGAAPSRPPHIRPECGRCQPASSGVRLPVFPTHEREAMLGRPLVDSAPCPPSLRATSRPRPCLRLSLRRPGPDAARAVRSSGAKTTARARHSNIFLSCTTRSHFGRRRFRESRR